MEKSPAKPQTLKCPSCGGIVIIKAVGISITAICSYCSSVIDVANENFQIIKKANDKIRHTLLEIGARGLLFGVTWEVIGYVEKSDGDYDWDEYLLYNPYYGFRFLTQNQGHWNFVKVLKTYIEGNSYSEGVSLSGKIYRIFGRGKARINYVKGEFYWRVKKSDSVSYADYIAPPFILSLEDNDEEITISLGRYLEPNEVASAFSIKNILSKEGVACNQPPPAQGKFLAIWIVAVVFILLAGMVQNISTTFADQANLYSSSTQIDFAEQDNTISTPSFIIPKKSNVLIQSASPLDNDWLELRLSLVNEQTNKEYSLTQGLESYHGYDSDGAWAEGSPYSKTYISSVPSGNYRLLIDVDAGSFVKGLPAKFSLSVTRDVPASSNFWIIVLMILFYPVLVTIRCWRFEQRRWSQSDYAPKIYQTGGDD